MSFNTVLRRLAALALFAAATTLPAQQPSEPASAAQPPAPVPYTIRTSTRLVILDLVVEDSKGHVVDDLKREDFHVTESGEPQTVLNFDPSGAHTPAPELNINSTAELDQQAPRAPVNIILLDEFNTRFEDMAFARYSLKKFLERQPGKLAIPTMLIAVSLQNFTVLRDYTQNKDEIISALDHHFSGNPWQAHQYSWVGERYATAFESLRRVAQAVVGHQGQKNMIWIGRGFPAVNFANMPVDTENRVYNAVQECVNVLRDARVTLYTIDPAGLQVYNTYGPAAEFNDPFGGNYQFAKLATATGGRTLYGRNDVDAEIGTAIRDGSSSYTLTYRPTATVPNPTRFRKIVVTVDRPGVKVYTREGYYLQRGPGRVDPVNPSRRLMADLAAADSSTMVYDGVPLRLENLPEKPDSYVIHIEPRSLAWTYATDTEPRRAEVILMVTTYDKKGKELKREARVIKGSAPPTVPPTGRLERGLNLSYDLIPDPKAVRVRFTVRVTASGRIGTVDAVPGQPVVAAATTHPAAPSQQN
ncbi:VWA domain-containing protein [Granulicella sp. WH15]|uniref:VWA domain-containing protein n=1 Tax=Granulicella sp. WH15 TaxID=2602070 RepID=UPI002102298D|nr:VWA domain-containing protein [Granulicella sp. WH15]